MCDATKETFTISAKHRQTANKNSSPNPLLANSQRAPMVVAKHLKGAASYTYIHHTYRIEFQPKQKTAVRKMLYTALVQKEQNQNSERLTALNSILKQPSCNRSLAVINRHVCWPDRIGISPHAEMLCFSKIFFYRSPTGRHCTV